MCITRGAGIPVAGMPVPFLPSTRRRARRHRTPPRRCLGKPDPSSTNGADPWSACLTSLERDLPPQQFATWIRPLRCEPTADGVRLVAPNRFVLQWVKDRFGPRISTMLRDATGNDLGVEFVIAPPGDTPSPEAEPAAAAKPAVPRPRLRSWRSLRPPPLRRDARKRRASIRTLTFGSLRHRQGEPARPRRGDCRSPSIRPPTTPCSSMAAWGWARRT